MKLSLSASSIAIAVTLTLASANTMANKVVLKPIDKTIATQVCYTAATEGLDVAKAIVKENRINFNKFRGTLKCNGLTLVDFTSKYAKKESSAKAETPARVTLVAKNSNVESQLCLDAVSMGEKAARAKYSIKTSVLCNNRDLPSFIRSFKKQNVTIRNTAK